MHSTVKVTNQGLEQLEALAFKKNPDPIIVRGNRAAYYLCSKQHLTWDHGLMQQIDNFN